MNGLFFKGEQFEYAIFFYIFIILSTLETIFPLRPRKLPLLKRLIPNFCLSGIVFILGSYLIKPAAMFTANWCKQQKFGFLQIIPLSYNSKFIIGFLLMDLSFYYWHRANHTFAFFRRFHKVHHIDPEMDIFTSFRFHFGEVLYSIVFRILQVGLIGLSITTYISYEFVFICSTMFHHSNLRLPLPLERNLNKILVTPRMHGIHHSIYMEEGNSNYSVIFCWWDKLHKSLRLNVPQKEITIGVGGYQSPIDNQLGNLLKTPFSKQSAHYSPTKNKYLKRNAARTTKTNFMLE